MLMVIMLIALTRTAAVISFENERGKLMGRNAIGKNAISR